MDGGGEHVAGRGRKERRQTLGRRSARMGGGRTWCPEDGQRRRRLCLGAVRPGGRWTDAEQREWDDDGRDRRDRDCRQFRNLREIGSHVPHSRRQLSTSSASPPRNLRVYRSPLSPPADRAHRA